VFSNTVLYYQPQITVVFCVTGKAQVSIMMTSIVIIIIIN